MLIKPSKRVIWLSDLAVGEVFRCADTVYMKARVKDQPHDVLYVVRLDTGDITEVVADYQVDIVYPCAELQL